MQGPFAAATIGNRNPPSDKNWETGKFDQGALYQVSQSFLDSDGDEHAVGEQWTFIGTQYSKFDDELTICTRKLNGEEWKIPLIWTKDGQGFVIEHRKHCFTRV